MNANEEDVGALPFETYQVFLDKIRALRPELHEYLKDAGFVINDENAYKRAVVAGFVDSANDRKGWEHIAKKFKYIHLNKIDTLCSELVSLSDSVIQNGTVLFCGCGNGDEIEWVKRNTSAKVIGLDYSRAMLKEHLKRFSKPDIILATCESIPIASESVNQVIQAGIESSSSRTLVDEVSRILVPGGEIRVSSIRCAEEFFPQHEEDFIECLKKAKYDEFLKNYAEKIFGTQASENDLTYLMENFDCTDSHVIGKMTHLTLKGFDVSYEFSKFPLMPRGYHLQNQCLQIPYTIVGKKPEH